MTAVDVNGLTKSFGSEKALNGITFTIPKGVLYGIIGADGAGKTTLLRSLVTLIDSDSGSITILDHTSTDSMAWIRSNVGYMPQRFSLYQDLTVYENMEFFASIFGVNSTERRTRMKRLLEFSRLDKFQNRRAGQLSGGMKQKLALSCALIHTPKIIILDEPTTGVDPVSRNEFWNILGDLRKEGVTIIVSTPYMDEATKCDELMILHKGDILANGTPETLLNSYPYKLYSISGGSSLLNWPSNLLPPAPIKLLYPSGGSLHAAVDYNESLSQPLITALSKQFKMQISASECKASIEDLFFFLLKRNR